jgi:cell division protein FtsL
MNALVMQLTTCTRTIEKEVKMENKEVVIKPKTEVTQDVIQGLTTDEFLRLITYKLSFVEFTKFRKVILERFEEIKRKEEDNSNIEFAQEVVEQMQWAYKDRVDQICIEIESIDFKQELVTEALKKQKEFFSVKRERLKGIFIEAIQLTGGTQVEGVAWRARIQKNPGALVVEDESAIPDFFKRGKFVISGEFDPSDVEKRKQLEMHCKGMREVYGSDYMIETVVDKTELKKLMNPKNENPLVIEGAHIEQGVSLRIESGKNKSRKKITQDEVKEIENE